MSFKIFLNLHRKSIFMTLFERNIDLQRLTLRSTCLTIPISMYRRCVSIQKNSNNLHVSNQNQIQIGQGLHQPSYKSRSKCTPLIPHRGTNKVHQALFNFHKEIHIPDFLHLNTHRLCAERYFSTEESGETTGTSIIDTTDNISGRFHYFHGDDGEERNMPCVAVVNAFFEKAASIMKKEVGKEESLIFRR